MWLDYRIIAHRDEKLMHWNATADMSFAPKIKSRKIEKFGGFLVPFYPALAIKDIAKQYKDMQ